MTRDRWDTLAASAPVNAGAARSAFSGGASYATPSWAVNEKHWTAPPPLRQPSAARGAINLVGLRVGRLLVLGLLDTPKTSKHRGLWVCRCTCGDYCGRRAKALMNPAHVDEIMCQVCKHTLRLRYHGESA